MQGLCEVDPAEMAHVDGGWWGPLVTAETFAIGWGYQMGRDYCQHKSFKGGATILTLGTLVPPFGLGASTATMINC